MPQGRLLAALWGMPRVVPVVRSPPVLRVTAVVAQLPASGPLLQARQGPRGWARR